MVYSFCLAFKGPHPHRRFQVSRCLIFGFWVKAFPRVPRNVPGFFHRPLRARLVKRNSKDTSHGLFSICDDGEMQTGRIALVLIVVAAAFAQAPAPQASDKEKALDIVATKANQLGASGATP